MNIKKMILTVIIQSLMLLVLQGEEISLLYRGDSQGNQDYRYLLEWEDGEGFVKGSLPGNPAAWGLSLPFLTAGDFSFTGLLKESFNYSAYTGKSAVFHEVNGFTLKRSGTPGHQTLYSIGGAGFGLFAVTREDKPGWTGAYLNLGESPFLLEGMILSSVSGECHWGLRGRVTGAVHQAYLSCLFSPGGLLAHYLLSLETRGWRPVLLLEYVTPGYRNPKGWTGRNYLKGVCSLDWEPLPYLVTGGEYNVSLEHPEKGDLFYKAREEVSAYLLLERKGGKGGFIWEKHFSYNSRGAYEEEERMKIQGTVPFQFFRGIISLDGTLSLEREGLEKGSAGISWKGEIWRGELEWEENRTEESTGGKLKITRKAGNLELIGKLEWKSNEINPILTLCWKWTGRSILTEQGVPE